MKDKNIAQEIEDERKGKNTFTWSCRFPVANSLLKTNTSQSYQPLQDLADAESGSLSPCC